MDIRKEIEKTVKVILSDLLYINNRKTNFISESFCLENKEKQNLFVFIKVDPIIFPILPTDNIKEELEGLKEKIKLKDYIYTAINKTEIIFVIPYNFEKNMVL